MNVAIYARYSSDNQREASIEDQIRICRAHAATQNWRVTDIYTDKAISGATLLRPGIQNLIRDAGIRKFSLILSESMDRLSRDQEDIAGLFKRMQFLDIRIFTLAEGDVSHLHIGLKGTMNALFLKDLADKTRRGLRGKIAKGESAGGICYGYDIAKDISTNGERIKGQRTINPEEAAVIRRIFSDYNKGNSPRNIAHSLNREKIPGPSGTVWGPSTINGNYDRGTGILNNELYIGRLVWNRLRYIKDPDTGKRVSRPNPETEWMIQDVPELRIVAQDAWDAVKHHQKGLAQKRGQNAGERLAKQRRPKFLLSGLVKCGCCGAGYVGVTPTLMGCAAARDKGTCQNRNYVRRDTLEQRVLAGLKDHLMAPHLFTRFCTLFTHHQNELSAMRRRQPEEWKADLAKVERQIAKFIDLMKEGMFTASMKPEFLSLEDAKAELVDRIKHAEAETPPPILHPAMAAVYKDKITSLARALNNELDTDAAKQSIRSLITRIVVTPQEGELNVHLEGDLAKMLTLATGFTQEAFEEMPEKLVKLTVVAGARNSRRRGWVESRETVPFHLIA